MLLPSMVDFPGQFFPQDLHYLLELTNYTDLVGEGWREFSVRGESTWEI